MRADRLVSIVLLLQANRRLTAGDLAERLEVSERTVRRDLDALAASGVPVYADRGKGGGWSLLEGWRTDLTGLTGDEVRALFLVAGPAATPGLGVEPAVRSVLRKLLAAVPARDRAGAARAQESILVDSIGWGRSGDNAPHLAALREALARDVRVRISYRKRGAAPTERLVDPYGLVTKGGTWYLVAGDRGEERTFRVSRIAAVTLTDEPADRDPGFDLERSWARTRQWVEGRRDHVVRLRIDPKVVGLLYTMIGSDRLRRLADPDEFEADFPNARTAAVAVAGFGALVEVLSPPETRDRLATVARELTALYT